MAMALLLVGPPASAVDELVTGNFDTKIIIGPDCGADSGICAEGTTTGNLKGQFTLGVTKIIPTAHTDETGVLLFIGEGTVETKDGSIVCKNSGVLQATSHGILTSLCVVTPGSGTGKWANAAGYFQVNGTASLIDFTATGDYRGFITQE